MKHYSKERKDAVLKRMMQPENAPVALLAEETGISRTLYDWRKHAIAKGLVVPEDTQNPENWPAQYKFAVVLETAVMNQAELSEYCRKKGLFAEQIAAWKEKCLQGNASAANQSKEDKRQTQLARNEVKQLKRELRRKDKALAALRAKVPKVIIPEKNALELVELPPNVRRKLQFVPVSYVSEVLEHALCPKPKVKKGRERSTGAKKQK